VKSNVTVPRTPNHQKLHPCLTGGKLNVKKGITLAAEFVFLNVSTVSPPDNPNIWLNEYMQILHTQRKGPTLDSLFPYTVPETAHIYIQFLSNNISYICMGPVIQEKRQNYVVY
jgi:hypothetical protein